MSGLVGQGVARVDGRAKVTGVARYAADNEVTGVLHGFLVMSTIARGEVVEIDTRAALAHPGVVAVYTHADMPKLTLPNFPYNRPFIPNAGHAGAPQRAAGGLRPGPDPGAGAGGRQSGEDPLPGGGSRHAAGGRARRGVPADQVPQQTQRGRPRRRRRGRDKLEVRIDQTYGSPMQHHNPIEPHTTTAVWEGGTLILYEYNSIR